MIDDDIPNPVPGWMASRLGLNTAHPAPARSPLRGRRPDGGRRPPERHFNGFDPAPQESDFPPDLEIESPAPAAVVAPAPELPVAEIVQAAVTDALAKAQAGLLTVQDLNVERERLIAFRPTIDDEMRELKQLKPDYWRERRAWLLVVRSQVHNRLHVINHQIGALNRAAAPGVDVGGEQREDGEAKSERGE